MMDKTILEQAYAEKIGTRYAAATANGTCALYAILKAADIGPGDEVIVPALTMSDTVLAVLKANAAPVFADADPDTFLISPQSIKDRITPKTKAIITAALYGLSPDMDAVLEAAAGRQLLVIEDNAQCMYGTYKGRRVGTLGHAAGYSFQSLRHLTCGEGGIAATNSPELAQKISRHLSLESNCHMPELCAAVALDQLENADYLVKRRINTAKRYKEVLKDTPWLKPQYVGKDYECTYWTFAVKLDHPCIRWGEFRDHFVSFGGDQISAAWIPDGLISEGNKSRFGKGLCPVAEELQGRLLQFKTDYPDEQDAKKQAEVLRKTIQFFNKWSIRQ